MKLIKELREIEEISNKLNALRNFQLRRTIKQINTSTIKL